MKNNPKLVSFNNSSAYVHHRAMINRRGNNAVVAVELMRQAVEVAPDNQEYRLDLAELYCEMGCHAQSNRLLLDMLAQSNPPSECYYGLALNQMGMNDLSGARKSLMKYRIEDPNGPHVFEVNRLFAELDIYDAMNRPASRKLHRAISIGDKACRAVQSGLLTRGRRLFEKSLSLWENHNEIRALYALTLLQLGEFDLARQEAERASNDLPISVRAFCVSAQIFSKLGEENRARNLLEGIIQQRPEGIEARLLIYTLCELKMYGQALECARIALQGMPFDRELLHIRAVACHFLGFDAREVAKLWLRILRIDPDDSIAKYYYRIASEGRLGEIHPEYLYQVPAEERERRYHCVTELIEVGLDVVKDHWNRDDAFRDMIRWCATSENIGFKKVALTVLSAVEGSAADSELRTLMFGAGLQTELKLHTAAMLHIRGSGIKELFPSVKNVENLVFSGDESILSGLPVGERQLVRHAAETLKELQGFSARQELALMWTLYRRVRPLRMEPLTRSEAAAAALAYVYLLNRQIRIKPQTLVRIFQCNRRRFDYYAGHIAGVLARYKGDANHENH